jgi:hypothetical protein
MPEDIVLLVTVAFGYGIFFVGSQEQNRMLYERIEEAVRDSTECFMACSRSGIGCCREIRMNFKRCILVIYE